jgi:hypothetical protein
MIPFFPLAWPPLVLVGTWSLRIARNIFEAGAGFGALAVVIALALVVAVTAFVSSLVLPPR